MKGLWLALALSAPAPALAADGGYLTAEPLGQRACYRLSRDAARTSSYIRDGYGTVSVESHDSGRYDLVIHAVFYLRFFGDQEATLRLHVPDDYFTWDYWPRLEHDGVIVTPEYEMQWLGKGDVTTLDGETFADAWHARLYDIDVSRQEGFTELLRKAAALEGVALDPAEARIDEIELTSYVKDGVPVLGGATMDLAVKTLGIRFKAGIDMTRSYAQYCPAR